MIDSGASGTSRVIRLEEARNRESEEKVPASALRVAGITPFTTIDFPGRFSSGMPLALRLLPESLDAAPGVFSGFRARFLGKA